MRPLPPHPSFEHLQNEAKALLKAHRNKKPDACAVLRQLRQFTSASDQDILAVELALHDVQFALAMDYGYPSWTALKKHVNVLSSKDAVVTERLQRARQHLRWQPKWTTMIACTKSCLDYLGAEMSYEWFFGGTGHAFVLNFGPDTCPSHPTAWNKHMYIPLAANLGCRLAPVTGPENDIEARKCLAWDTVRKALDDGKACFGWNLGGSLEYSIINGYDDTGYLYEGYVSSTRQGSADWRKLDWLEIWIVSRDTPADDSTVVRSALDFALALTREPTKWAGEDRKTGLAGYNNWLTALDNWLTALANAPATPFNGHGLAYNLAVWNECRAHAATFLEEAAGRLAPLAQNEFTKAFEHYRTVANALAAATALFPWQPANWDKMARDTERIAAVRLHIQQARDEEARGLAAFETIITQLR